MFAFLKYFFDTKVSFRDPKRIKIHNNLHNEWTLNTKKKKSIIKRDENIWNVNYFVSRPLIGQNFKSNKNNLGDKNIKNKAEII